MNAGDTGFMLICTAFVFFMTPGLAFFRRCCQHGEGLKFVFCGAVFYHKNTLLAAGFKQG